MPRRRFASSRAIVARIVVYGETSPVADKMPHHSQKMAPRGLDRASATLSYSTINKARL